MKTDFPIPDLSSHQTVCISNLDYHAEILFRILDGFLRYEKFQMHKYFIKPTSSEVQEPINLEETHCMSVLFHQQRIYHFTKKRCLGRMCRKRSKQNVCFGNIEKLRNYKYLI